MATILLTHSQDAFSLYYGNRALAELSQLGSVLRNPLGHEPDEREVIALAKDADIIVAFRIPGFPARTLDQLPRTRAICRVAVDVRNIDIEAASRNGILVTHATPGFVASVSEWVMGAMINVGRRVTDASLIYRRGEEPPAHVGTELRNSNLGVIGYGAIARRVTQLGLAFGMKVSVYDPYAKVDHPDIRQVGLDEVIANADYLVCLAVATAETAHLMNAASFARMRRGAYFINASRGELVDEAALLNALDSGQLAGCALDVGMALDEKPSLTLARHPKVVATPHIAGLTVPAAEHQAMDTVRQVRAIVAGETPPGALNLEHATRLKQPWVKS